MKFIENLNKLKIHIKNIHYQYLYYQEEYESYKNVKIINLTEGKKCLVSYEDYDLVSKLKWYCCNSGYARSTINGKNYLMHRFLLNPDENLFVDHINGNRLDNRRVNLRIVPHKINNENKNKQSNSISKYRGVTFNKRDKKFISYVQYNSNRIIIGYFNNEIEAAINRDKYLVSNNLEHIQLNFPEKKYEYLESEFNINKSSKKNSVYIGVQYAKKENKYYTQIQHNGKKYYFSCSNDPMQCAIEYDKFIVKNKILGKKLNFPENYPNYDQKIIKTLCEYIDTNKIKLIIPSSKENIIIDKEDYDKVKYYSISIDCLGYVRCRCKNKIIRLHRLVMDCRDSKIFIDHIDSNKLNNSKSNLRISNNVLNPQNRSKSNKILTSKYYGVSKKSNGYWHCAVRINGILKAYSTKSEEYAARLRDIFILLNNPDSHYKLNFKWETKDIDHWKEMLIKYINGSNKDNDRFNGIPKTHPIRKIYKNLGIRIYKIMAKYKFEKNFIYNDLIGCSPQEFKEYLEHNFSDKMSFDNYGKWKIGYISPINNLKNEDDLKLYFNYKNIIPMWDNI